MKAGFGYTIGRRHAAETDADLRICQDLAASYTDDEISIIAVADGKAGRNMPAAAVTAAQVNIDTMIAFFRDPATWRIKQKNDFKETALRMLDSSLETVAGGEEFSYEELRATVSAIAVRKNGEFLAISIGDGTIVAFDQDLQPRILIPPYREGPKNRTVYTNDPEAAKAHIAVWGGTLRSSKYLAFAAFTDGADALMRRAEEGAQTLRTAAACTLFGSGDEFIQQAISEIAEKDTRDDVSLAVLVAETSEASVAAKKVILERRAAKEAAAEAEAAEKPAEEPTTEQPAETPEAEPVKLDKLPDPPMPEQENPEAPVEEAAAEEPAEEPEAEPVAEEPAADEAAASLDVPVNADPTPAEVTVLRAVYAEPLTARELVAGGHIRKGRVLENVLPLIRANRIRYENGKFYGNE